jgi:uncharacterized protein YbaR (Trm112 family)
MANDELDAMLACPLGKATLRQEGEFLVCTRCGPKFEIRDGIPSLLIEEAELPPGCETIADLECVRSGAARLDPD